MTTDLERFFLENLQQAEARPSTSRAVLRTLGARGSATGGSRYNPGVLTSREVPLALELGAKLAGLKPQEVPCFD